MKTRSLSKLQSDLKKELLGKEHLYHIELERKNPESNFHVANIIIKDGDTNKGFRISADFRNKTVHNGDLNQHLVYEILHDIFIPYRKKHGGDLAYMMKMPSSSSPLYVAWRNHKTHGHLAWKNKNVNITGDLPFKLTKKPKRVDRVHAEYLYYQKILPALEAKYKTTAADFWKAKRLIEILASMVALSL